MKKWMLWLTLLAVFCCTLVACELKDTAGTDTTAAAVEEKTEAMGSDGLPAETVPAETVPAETMPVETTDPDWGVMPIDPTEWESIESPYFNLPDSYAQDEYLFLRAEHLVMPEGSRELPAVLWISDLSAWKSFFAGQNPDGGVTNTALGNSLERINEAFFSDHSLLVLVTEGRSGSVRYRVDGVTSAEGTLSVALTAVVPDAVTMDIVHWCVVIPVTKAEVELPLNLICRDEAANGGEAAHPGQGVLRFGYTGSQSYEKDGILYGRLDDDWQGLHPGTEFITSYSAWQLCCSVSEANAAHMDPAFLAGLGALNQEFFAEKSLLLLFLVEGSGSRRHRVDEVAVKDGELTVTVTTLYPEIGTCDMASWVILIPVDKEAAGLPVHVETAIERMG